MLDTFLPHRSCSAHQTVKVQNPGSGAIPLDKGWWFHLGDDKAWADPALDDSGWEPIRADQTWGQQNHPSYAGFAWYRREQKVWRS